ALAEVLVDAGQRDDPRVAELTGEAAATSESLGLAVFRPRLERLAARATTTTATAGARVPEREPTGDVADEPPAPRARVAVLGTFEVRDVDGDTPRWTSRKARSLLKILVARRGAPIAREELMGMLWPDEDPADLTNRMAVAGSTVRRAPRPPRTPPGDALVRAEAGSLRLVTRSVDVDVERFLGLADRALAAHRDDDPAALERLEEALAAHQGEALPDEPYEAWADAL